MELFENIREGENEFFEWFYFLALALILAFGTIQTTGTALNTDKPVVSVVSCSMYPEYHKGDILIVNGEDYSRIETGEVVVYKVPDRIDFTLDGVSYTLERNSPDYNASVETPIGKVKLIDVKADLTNGNDVALLKVDGERVSVREGQSEPVSGTTLTAERVYSMPIPVVHRVIEKDEESLQTKGDANRGQLDFESNVRPFQIHGTTAFKIPRLGVVKILAMDLVGFQGDKPFVIDRYSPCR